MKILTFSGLLLCFACSIQANENRLALNEPEDTLVAEFHDDHIDLSDGRELLFVKNQLPHTGSQLVMMAPSGATVTIRYADGLEPFTARVPFVYKVPLSRVHEKFRLIVDEGGPLFTWTLEFNHESGYSLEFSSEE